MEKELEGFEVLEEDSSEEVVEENCEFDFDTRNESYDKIESEIKNMGEKEIRSKTYGRIFDTDFYWKVPYLIDVKKYKSLMGKDSRMTDNNTESLNFSCEIWRGMCTNYTFFAWSNREAEKNNDWLYDCYQKDDFEGYTFSDFKKFITDITQCIIGVDKEAVKRNIDEVNASIKQAMKLNETLLKLTEN